MMPVPLMTVWMRAERNACTAARTRASTPSKSGIFFPDRSAASSRRTTATTAGRGRSIPSSAWSTFSTAGIARREAFLVILSVNVAPACRGLMPLSCRSPCFSGLSFHANCRRRRAHDPADDGVTPRAVFLQDLQHLGQPMRTDAKQQAAAGLRVRQQNFLRDGHAVPFCKPARRFQVFATAARNAIFCDEPENLFADDRHARGVDLRTDPAGAAH